MAALTETGARRLHGATVGTTAEHVGLSSPVKQVFVTNLDTDPMYAKTYISHLHVTDDTGMSAVAAADDEAILIPPGKTRRVFKSSRRAFVRLTLVGNASSYAVEGSDYAIITDLD